MVSYTAESHTWRGDFQRFDIEKKRDTVKIQCGYSKYLASPETQKETE